MDVVLVDKKDKIVGYKEKFAAHKNPVPLHRAVSVIIFDKAGKKMLLQKRAEEKPTWPGFWSNACCTHPLPGESYKAAASRRLKEEMGFITPLKEVFRFIYQAKYDKTWGENEYDMVFIGHYSGKIKLDPKEAADYRWVSLEKLKKDIKKNLQIYTPWFKLILKRLWK
jgi:isopentenyl-diphosphate delta-isomerase